MHPPLGFLWFSEIPKFLQYCESVNARVTRTKHLAQYTKPSTIQSLSHTRTHRATPKQSTSRNQTRYACKHWSTNVGYDCRCRNAIQHYIAKPGCIDISELTMRVDTNYCVVMDNVRGATASSVAERHCCRPMGMQPLLVEHVLFSVYVRMPSSIYTHVIVRVAVLAHM